jgi:hypothetical protein
MLGHAPKRGRFLYAVDCCPMMTQNDIEEALSRAYVFAVASRAGVDIAGTFKDYGVDGTFRRIAVLPDNTRVNTGFPVDFQLKASINCTVGETSVSYRMKAVAYNKLVWRRNNGGIPIVLILMVLPNDPEHWMAHSEDELLLRQCCYWHLVGETETDSATILIDIPRSQALTPTELNQLLDAAAAGEFQ